MCKLNESYILDELDGAIELLREGYDDPQSSVVIAYLGRLRDEVDTGKET